MGLSIHYRLDFSGSDDDAKRFVSRLHEVAVRFGAGEVTPLRELAGEAAALSTAVVDEDSVLKLAASSWGQVDKHPHPVDALRLCGFVLAPGQGCEPAPMGLAQFPASIMVDGRAVDTELGEGWHWVSHVKTEYASNPQFGGIQNFLQCHLTICALLEKAREFGVTVFVDDESGFWEHRSVEQLVHSVTRLNQIMAGLVGAMKDAEDEGEVGGAIQEFTNFEQLKAEAMANPALAESMRTVAGEIKRHRDEP